MIRKYPKFPLQTFYRAFPVFMGEKRIVNRLNQLHALGNAAEIEEMETNTRMHCATCTMICTLCTEHFSRSVKILKQFIQNPYSSHTSLRSCISMSCPVLSMSTCLSPIVADIASLHPRSAVPAPSPL